MGGEGLYLLVSNVIYYPLTDFLGTKLSTALDLNLGGTYVLVK